MYEVNKVSFWISASGKNVTTSEKSLARAKALFECEDLDIGKGFQMGKMSF